MQRNASQRPSVKEITRFFEDLLISEYLEQNQALEKHNQWLEKGARPALKP